MSQPQNMPNYRSVDIKCEPGFEVVVSECIFQAGFYGLEEKAEDGEIHFIAHYSISEGKRDPLEKLHLELDALTLESEKKPATILADVDITEEDWERKWREGLGFIEIGERLLVRPSWIEYTNTENRVQIIIDPKMAFGTGEHETTRLCLEVLEKMTLKGKSILDIGCGSAVLSIAAAKLGARCVIGFDKDPFSVKNAKENLKINRVTNRVEVFRIDLDKAKPGKFDVICANMISSILNTNLVNIHGFLQPEGVVIFSGILAKEEKAFTQHLVKAGFKIDVITKRGEWIAFQTH